MIETLTVPQALIVVAFILAIYFVYLAVSGRPSKKAPTMSKRGHKAGAYNYKLAGKKRHTPFGHQLSMTQAKALDELSLEQKLTYVFGEPTTLVPSAEVTATCQAWFDGSQLPAEQVSE
jgi:hypothetical protein